MILLFGGLVKKKKKKIAKIKKNYFQYFFEGKSMWTPLNFFGEK